MSADSSHLSHRVVEHLACIYPEENHRQLADEYVGLMGLTDQCASPLPHHNNWDETDNILITYGDTLVANGELPLTTLKKFVDHHLKDVVSGIHILPFFPWSSDDGFSVMDYLSVNPSLGGWGEISAIANNYRLMADLVINHMSSRSRWFENFKKRIDPGKDYFFEASPEDDLSEVVRPRNSPLLTEYDTADGKRHVWCTFSADQVDLNFSNPRVLGEFINIIRHYLQWGVKIFRMDAVAFLWKQVGTPSIHRQQTHEIIKLLRTLIEHHSPDAIIITETNVPNRENLTYFGNANEAHVVYNFSLPPLLLYTLVSGNCQHLKTWMMSMPPAQSGTAYLNFVASHDGIGLRPLDGLIGDDDRNKLVDAMAAAGGKVTYRKSREGDEKAYEINIALYSALKGTLDNAEDGFQLERFICAHAIMLALEGIPAIYIHSLLGTENDYKRVEHTGRTRSINRHVWKSETLEEVLADTESHHHTVFFELKRLLSIRNQQPAFHPNATQFTLHLGFEVFAFWRQSINRAQSIFSLSNVTSHKQVINLADINLINTDNWIDLISGKNYNNLDGQLVLAPYQTVWISNR
ncbi:MAG: sugar phosphorylase [Oceanicoccus sp.]